MTWKEDDVPYSSYSCVTERIYSFFDESDEEGIIKPNQWRFRHKGRIFPGKHQRSRKKYCDRRNEGIFLMRREHNRHLQRQSSLHSPLHNHLSFKHMKCCFIQAWRLMVKNETYLSFKRVSIWLFAFKTSSKTDLLCFSFYVSSVTEGSMTGNQRRN